jgi:hypothetical protein
MTRVLSGAALIAIAVTVVWFAPDVVFQLFAAALVVLRRARELVALARASDLHEASIPSWCRVMLTAGVVGASPAMRSKWH